MPFRRTYGMEVICLIPVETAVSYSTGNRFQALGDTAWLGTGAASQCFDGIGGKSNRSS